MFLPFFYCESRHRNRMTVLNNRQQAHDSKKEAFTSTYADPTLLSTLPRVEATISDLVQWHHYKSWSFCSKCCSLSKEKLLQNYAVAATKDAQKQCQCSIKKYVVPDVSQYPDELLNLSTELQQILSPFR